MSTTLTTEHPATMTLTIGNARDSSAFQGVAGLGRGSRWPGWGEEGFGRDRCRAGGLTGRLVTFSILAVWSWLVLLGCPGSCAEPAANPPIPNFEPNIPVLFLEATNPIVSEVRTSCVVRLVYPKQSPGGPTGPIEGAVRIHGASSQGYPKKSYSLALSQGQPLIGPRTNAHWVLNAAYIDRSLMRHKLSYDLFRSLGGNNHAASSSRFVEVFVNRRYNGVYLLMERVDRRLLRLRGFQSNDVAHACMYKAVDHSANFAQGGHAGYEQAEPDPAVIPYWRPIDSFNRFVCSAPPAHFFNSVTGIVSRLDLENAIDFHLLVLLTSNSDGHDKNYFFARDGQETGPVTNRFFFVPWDYDATFGRSWEASRYPHNDWLSNRLFDRLLSDAAYRARFTARWNQLRQREFSEKTIHGMMDEAVKTLGEAAGRNAARWPTRNAGYPDQLTFAQDVAQMKAWVVARLAWLDEEINQRLQQRGG